MSYQDREVLDGNGRLETPEDLKSEDRVKVVVEKELKCRLVKQQTYDPMDFIAFRDKASGTETVALVECRERSVSCGEYAELFFGKEKYIQLITVANALWVPAIFVVTFTDAMKWIDLTKVVRPKLAWGDRGNVKHKRPTDNHEVILIPVSQMKEFVGALR